MNKTRTTRINEEIRKDVSDIIDNELKDHRMTAMTTVTKVEVSNDLKHAKIYVSVLGDESKKKEILEGLESGSGFIRKRLAEKLNLRNTPILKFLLDDSAEYGIRISKLIDEVNK